VIPSTLANIKRAYTYFRALDPEFDNKPQPVIGCPLWFIEEVQSLYGKDPKEDILDQIHGMMVIERAEISEPLMILADGRFVNVVPRWARAIATHLQATSIADGAKTEVELPADPVDAATGD